MSTLSVPDPIDVGEIEERDDLPTTHGKTANDWEILFQTLKRINEPLSFLANGVVLG